MAERDNNYTIMEGYELPSRGLIYDKPVNAHVELRSMTARDEMKRLSPSSTPFKTLADIIEGCMIEKPGVHVYDMAIGDYEYLLHKLRIVSYGDEYKIELRCPYCGETFDAITHLEDIMVKPFDQEKFESLRNLSLPKSGHDVVLRFQTPRILDEIDSKTREYKRRYKDASINFDLLAILVNSIDTIDGVERPPYEIEDFVNKLPAYDMTKIINTLDELNKCIGIENDIQVPCKNCGADINTFFRFGTEFFRPSTI